MGLTTYALAIPDDDALLGLRVYTQGVVVGDALQPCNALDLVLGLAP